VSKVCGGNPPAPTKAAPQPCRRAEPHERHEAPNSGGFQKKDFMLTRSGLRRRHSISPKQFAAEKPPCDVATAIRRVHRQPAWRADDSPLGMEGCWEFFRRPVPF